MEPDPPAPQPEDDMHPPESIPFRFQETLAAARAGDGEAREAIFERFYPRVQAMVHRALAKDLRQHRPWLSARFSTGDVVQEVFRSLLSNMGTFEGTSEEAFTGYLAMVVRNRLLDAIRYHEASQRDVRRTAGAPVAEDASSTGPGPATSLAAADEVQLFARALKTFSERDQLLLRARLEEEATFQELADRLGFPSKFAARRAFYAAQASLVIRMHKEADA